MIHKDIGSLVPDAQSKCQEFLTRCSASSLLIRMGYRVILLETLRELAVQMAYFSRGRIKTTAADKKKDYEFVRDFFRLAGIPWVPSLSECNIPVTWTLDSNHLGGRAFDAWLSKDGKVPDWKAPQEAIDEMVTIARAVGLKCGADFPDKQRDSPHFEI